MPLTAAQLEDQVRLLKNRRDRYRKALEFYAEATPQQLAEDGGLQARQALNP